MCAQTTISCRSKLNFEACDLESSLVFFAHVRTSASPILTRPPPYQSRSQNPPAYHTSATFTSRNALRAILKNVSKQLLEQKSLPHPRRRPLHVKGSEIGTTKHV
ncbi:hypothetical protein HII31_07426 [Pseudocercospora fuligena]|uniref:Uncharacterized protein n=1 Tax=Pseudocercospora fuligena TaxID=685502 RepID=A0A8H6RHX4_9PEZI|nr:hypothetical protein HII31_07426 [Pseudocercospora fuligena]